VRSVYIGRDLKGDNGVFEESIPTFSWREGTKPEILTIGYPVDKNQIQNGYIKCTYLQC
jgi:hypothetical protein